MTQYRIADEQILKFWSCVEPFVSLNACWFWTARKRRGYGEFPLRLSGTPTKYLAAHRLAYELLVGEIPDGFVIDHLCRNHSCVNPDHLEPVTNAENVRRGRPGRGIRFAPGNIQLCPEGHHVVGDNAMPQKHRSRPRCRACFRRQYAEFMDRRAAA